MNLNQDLNKKIKQIDWTKTYPAKYNNIKNKLESAKEQVDNINKLESINGQATNINILVNGDKEYIEIVNNNIEKAVENMNIESRITIINCYNITRVHRHK